MTLLIRDYCALDYEPVVALWCECFPEIIEGETAFQKMLARKLAFQPHPFLVAVTGDRVVGTAVGGMDGICAWVYLVAVHPSARRQSVGSQLVRGVVDRLRDMGADKVALQYFEARPELRQFYESLGFKVEPRVTMGQRVG
jgi:hypothetical protein